MPLNLDKTWFHDAFLFHEDCQEGLTQIQQQLVLRSKVRGLLQFNQRFYDSLGAGFQVHGFLEVMSSHSSFPWDLQLDVIPMGSISNLYY